MIPKPLSVLSRASIAEQRQMVLSALLGVGLIESPDFWRGLITAVIGVLFWFVGLAVLYVIYERYLKDKDRPNID